MLHWKAGGIGVISILQKKKIEIVLFAKKNSKNEYWQYIVQINPDALICRQVNVISLNSGAHN